MLREADLTHNHTGISYTEEMPENSSFTTSSTLTPAYPRRVVVGGLRLSLCIQSDPCSAVPLNEFKPDTTGCELPGLFRLCMLAFDCQGVTMTGPRITYTETKFHIEAHTAASSTDENLSPEDREAQEKGLQMAARIEHLYQTDEGFRLWYHKGIDDIESGRTVTFSEDGWKEE